MDKEINKQQQQQTWQKNKQKTETLSFEEDSQMANKYKRKALSPLDNKM